MRTIKKLFLFMFPITLSSSHRRVPWLLQPLKKSRQFFARRELSSQNDATRTRTRKRAYLAVGSNMGDRFNHIYTGLQQLSPDVRLLRTSALFETAPMYVTDQPAFLNGVVEIETTLEPHDLLARIKHVEENAGRLLHGGIRNGPRPLDLDILLYDTTANSSLVLNDAEKLEIPHPRISERDFVLQPLVEMGASNLIHPVLNGTVGQLWKEYLESQNETEGSAVRVLPLPRGRMLYLNRTLVMGILNVTPDSFSDGGGYVSVETAVEQALAMVQDGADIIDIGGESTRPGAKEVSINAELNRTIPVIEGIRKFSDIPISIDTRHALVAEAAVNAGADIVNDVSGGMFDEAMFSTLAELAHNVPMILMHMRGTPETMQTMTKYDTNIVDEVVGFLMKRSEAASREAGIHRWQQVLDPGIGFAKEMEGNLLLLRQYNNKLHTSLGLPLMLGTSRKGFIGTLSGEGNPVERDFGTLSSCVTAICLDDLKGSTCSRCNILRVHNVKGIRQGIIVMDAIRSAKSC